jgi:preprotein translocase subunit SecD
MKRKLIPWLFGGLALLLLLVAVATGAVLLLRTKQPLVWHLVLQVEPAAGDPGVAVNQTISVIESRLNAAGVPRFAVHPDSDAAGKRILIDLPRSPEPERIKSLISAQGKLELLHIISPPNPVPAQTYATRDEAAASLKSNGTTPPPNRRILPYPEALESSNGPHRWVVVETPAVIDGSDLRDANAANYTRGPDYQVNFSLKQSGADKFRVWTAAHLNEYIGVVLNDEVKSIAFIRGPIADQGEIIGRFTKQSAEDLALVLRSGAFPGPVRLVAERVDR